MSSYGLCEQKIWWTHIKTVFWLCSNNWAKSNIFRRHTLQYSLVPEILKIENYPTIVHILDLKSSKKILYVDVHGNMAIGRPVICSLCLRLPSMNSNFLQLCINPEYIILWNTWAMRSLVCGRSDGRRCCLCFVCLQVYKQSRGILIHTTQHVLIHVIDHVLD